MSDQTKSNIAATGILGLWVTPDDIENAPEAKGAYVLALRLSKVAHIGIPRMDQEQLMPGWYLYVGSANGSGGIRSRVKRHFRSNKKAHWHIDRLTVKAVEMAALAVPDGHECELVRRLLRSRLYEVAVPGFGSTDCRYCESHLLASLAF
jgi:Uri superfamily endonuclease